MSFDLIRQNVSKTLLTIALLLGLFWLRNEWDTPAVSSFATELSPIGQWMQSWFASMPRLSIAVSLFALLLGGILLVQISVTNMILRERNYLPATLYIIIGCGNYLNLSEPIPYLISLLLIITYILIIGSFSRITQYGLIFNAALCIGIGMLIYAPIIILIPALLIGLIIFKKGWRDLCIMLIGMLLPLAVASYVYWGLGQSYSYLIKEGSYQLIRTLSYREQFLTDMLEPDLLFYWGVLAIVVTFMLFSARNTLTGMRTRPTKVHHFFMFILLFSGLLILSPSRSVWEIPLVAAPLAILLSAFLSRRKITTANIYYLLLIVSVLLLNVTPFLFSR